MGDFLYSIFGFAVLGFFVWLIISFLDAAAKPRKKRGLRARNQYRRTRPIKWDYSQRISDYQYFDNEAPGEFLVYFIENPKLGALKIGVGRAGRVHQILNSYSERTEDSEPIGWQVLRVAVFSRSSESYKKGQEKAYEAERRVKFYWKSQGQEPFLTDEQMGYSKVNKRSSGETIWIRTQGWSETVRLGEVCEVSSWKYVTSSPGFQGEISSFSTGRELKLLNPEHAERLRPPNLKFPTKQSDKRQKDSTEPGEELSNAFDQDTKSHRSRPISDGSQIGNFHARTKVSENSECVIWTGSVTDSNYGIMPWNGVLTPAHRISWMIQFDEELGDAFLMNQCGNRLCVNTNHWNKVSKQEYKCTTLYCDEPSLTTYKEGLCKKCGQRAKVIRRAVRERTACQCPTPDCRNMSTGSAINSRCVECAAKARYIKRNVL